MKTLKKKNFFPQHNRYPKKLNPHTSISDNLARISPQNLASPTISHSQDESQNTTPHTESTRHRCGSTVFLSLSRERARSLLLAHSSRGSAARGLHGSAALSSCGSCGSTRGSTRGSTLGSTLGLTPGSMLGSMRGSTSSCAGWSGDAGERVGGTETFVRGEDAGARGGGDASGGTCGVDLVDGGAGRRNLPHKLSDLPPHRT